ncbi:MAG: hypothetical protein ACRC1K_11605 [Planctomycetia bacterium]
MKPQSNDSTTWIVALALIVVGVLAIMPGVLAKRKAVAPAAVHAHSEAEGHGEEHGDDGHHAHTIRGNPPPDAMGPGTSFLAIDPVLFIWTLGLFLLLHYGLTKLAWQPMLASLDERDQRIAAAVAAAEEARAEAGRLLSQTDEELAKAHEETRRILDAARSEATKESDARLAKARDEAAAAQKQALADLEAAKLEALAQIRQSAPNLSVAIASRLAGRSFSTDGLAAVVAEERS